MGGSDSPWPILTIIDFILGYALGFLLPFSNGGSYLGPSDAADLVSLSDSVCVVERIPVTFYGRSMHIAAEVCADGIRHIAGRGGKRTSSLVRLSGSRAHALGDDASIPVTAEEHLHGLVVARFEP